MSHVTLYGKAARRRAPTGVLHRRRAEGRPGWPSRWRQARLSTCGSGNNYALELCRALGPGAMAGAVRAGLVHYNDDTDVDRLLAAVADLA